MEGISLDIGSAIGSAASNMMSQASDVLPIALGVFAAVAGVFFGFKIFKRLTGARS